MYMYLQVAVSEMWSEPKNAAILSSTMLNFCKHLLIKVVHVSDDTSWNLIRRLHDIMMLWFQAQNLGMIIRKCTKIMPSMYVSEKNNSV